MKNEKNLFILNDDILFRQCSLADAEDCSYGDCTNFSQSQKNWKNYYTCEQYGIHYHCAKHPEIELDYNSDSIVALYCPKCRKSIRVGNFSYLRTQCLKLLRRDNFKNAHLVRLDNWYIPEITKKVKLDSDYWMTSNIKVDKDGDTMVVLYVGLKGDKEKAQFFIKPEKGQLTSDHKDMDPSEVISKIEVTLKDRKLTQTFNSET